MSSLGEQISTKEIEHCELSRKGFRFDETFSHEHVFANKLKIRNDDSDRSKESLKTFGKLRTTKITWIHSDESTASRVETDFIALKKESLLAFFDSIKHGLELDGAHREHLGNESVELIETTPRSRGGKSFENTSETKIIHVIGAVEDVASLSSSVGEILSCLCLSSTGGTSGSATHLQVKSLSSCDVNSIGKRCDDESGTVSEIFVTVPKLGISNSEEEIALLGIKVYLELSLPLEVIRGSTFFDLKLFNNISGVSIVSNQTHNFLSHGSIEITLHHLNEI
jgi:hypothetical protein